MSQATLDKLLAAMKTSKGVPASESAVASVLGALDDTPEGKQQVVNHIIEDFALTQKVLKLANSSMYAPFSAGSDSVSSAVNILGSEAVLHLALGADLVSDDELLQDDCLSQTLLASELARNLCADRAEEASVATLMVEIGRLMVGRYLPQEAHAIARKVASGKVASEATADVLGMSYQDLGMYLAAHWNLPQKLRATIDGTGDPTLVGIARFSSSASSLIHEGKAEAAQALLQALDLPGIDKSTLGAMVSAKADLVRQRQATRQAPSGVAALETLLKDVLADKKTTLDDLCGTMLPGIAMALNTAHCLLFMVNRTGEMRIRCAFGKGTDELKSRLRISAEFMPTAFHAAIKNNMDVSIADVSKLKDASLPGDYRSLLPQVTKFIILPIAHSKVSGLLYCDWDSNTVLQQAEMEAVKKLRDVILPFFPA
jgi:HD-like signal output (HDOD) protein